jgi:hypothetical protein
LRLDRFDPAGHPEDHRRPCSQPAADDARAYLARARGMVDVDIRPRSASPFDSDWMKILLAALFILGGGYALRRRFRAA